MVQELRSELCLGKMYSSHLLIIWEREGCVIWSHCSCKLPPYKAMPYASSYLRALCSVSQTMLDLKPCAETIKVNRYANIIYFHPCGWLRSSMWSFDKDDEAWGSLSCCIRCGISIPYQHWIRGIWNLSWHSHWDWGCYWQDFMQGLVEEM